MKFQFKLNLIILPDHWIW